MSAPSALQATTRDPDLLRDVATAAADAAAAGLRANRGGGTAVERQRSGRVDYVRGVDAAAAEQVRELDMLRDVAIAAADAAAAVVRAHRGSGTTVEWQQKGRVDYVSVVYTAAEEHIRESVAQALPDARVIGEELTPGDVAGSGITFVVDPLDGTTNFLHDYPEYAVSVGGLIDRETVVGVVVNVPLRSRYVAVAGRGATLD